MARTQISSPLRPFFRRADGIQPAGTGYHSVLITRKGSAFTSLAALKGATLVLVDPSSTSGYLVPQRLFSKKSGLPPLKECFSKITLTGKHDLSIEAVIEGRADAAFVGSYLLMQVVTAGKVRLEDVNVLWTSPRLPDLPFVLRGDICEGVKQKIIETFLAADQTNQGREFLEMVGGTRIVKANDADYDTMLTIGE